MSERTTQTVFFVCPNCEAQQVLSFSLETEKRPLHMEEFRHLKDTLKDGDKIIKELEESVNLLRHTIVKQGSHVEDLEKKLELYEEGLKEYKLEYETPSDFTPSWFSEQGELVEEEE